MSYSFSVRKPTKAEAIVAAHEEFDKIVKAQPIHAHDIGTALSAANGAIQHLPDDEARDVLVSMSGSVAIRGTYPDDYKLAGVTTNVNAALVDRDA